MAKGYKTPGSGRKPGGLNKVTVATRAILGDFGPTIVENLCRRATTEIPIGLDPALTVKLVEWRAEAEALLLPYILAKQAPVDESGNAQSITFKLNSDDKE